MVTKWRSVWFQTEKVKSTKTLYENEIRKKNTGDFLDRLLSSPTALSSSFFLVSLRTCIHGTSRKWRAAAVLTAVLVEGKSGEKDAEQDEEEFVELSVAAAVLRRRRARGRFNFQAAHEEKERNENVDAPA